LALTVSSEVPGHTAHRIINNDIFDALAKVKRWAEFQVFFLVTFADDFNHSFGNFRDGGFGFGRFVAKDGNVRTFV